MQLANDDPGTLANAAMVLASFGEDIETMSSVERAVTLNPSFARGWYIAGILRNWAGQPEMAIERQGNRAAARPARAVWLRRVQYRSSLFLYAAL